MHLDPSLARTEQSHSAALPATSVISARDRSKSLRRNAANDPALCMLCAVNDLDAEELAEPTVDTSASTGAAKKGVVAFDYAHADRRAQTHEMNLWHVH
eukprot:48030-Eustigmatos_ZCMA.PRE.1